VSIDDIDDVMADLPVDDDDATGQNKVAVSKQTTNETSDAVRGGDSTDDNAQGPVGDDRDEA
jgi:hypothetical protein